MVERWSLAGGQPTLDMPASPPVDMVGRCGVLGITEALEAFGVSPELATLIERLGVPVVILLAAGVFVYRVFWPFIVAQIEARDTVLREQVKHAHEQREKEVTRFLQAMDKRDEQFRPVAENLQRLTDEIRQMRVEGGHR